MNGFKPITEADLGLTPEEVRELVEGAQTFLRPAADERDGERVDLRRMEGNS